ncbi:hypothetical protein HDF23_000969 [Mucilaginibacter lappiensis]|uniref:Uncharacterized protein n=1 Tax=Mucilaginibacter lappiensis TaxID=354630 RepID=A0ABR6PEP9_9SPHI|nr:hypothetical protein [Mucilaginibacter lappiensis]
MKKKSSHLLCNNVHLCMIVSAVYDHIKAGLTWYSTGLSFLHCFH